MKFALAQVNQTIGDFEENFSRMAVAIDRAREQGADLCIFPEMATTGCPPHDLLEYDNFINKNMALLDRMASLTSDIGVLVGYVRPSPNGLGKTLQNAAALIADGEIVATHAKTRLSIRDVFNEHRYFAAVENVKPVDFKGTMLGITIHDDIFQMARTYQQGEWDRVEALVNQGAEVIINIAASPFTLENLVRRQNALTDCAKKHHRPVIFVNQVGGNDELVFDGDSMMLSPEGSVVGRAKRFASDLLIVDLEKATTPETRIPMSDEESAVEALALGIKDFVEKRGYRSALIALTGDLDSSVTAAIAVRALGPDKVHAIATPSAGSPAGIDACIASLAEALGIHLETHSVDRLLATLSADLAPLIHPAVSCDDSEPAVLHACVRSLLVQLIAEQQDHLILSAKNKSDLIIDCPSPLVGDLSVLADVPKTLVHRIAHWFAEGSLSALKPLLALLTTAGLEMDQLRDDRPIPYTVLDPILDYHIDHGLDGDIIISLGFDETAVKRILALVKANEQRLRQLPLGLKVTSKAFGKKRRMPVAHHYKS